jgi:thioredoxin 1
MWRPSRTRRPDTATTITTNTASTANTATTEPVALAFVAHGCGPCQALTSALRSLEGELAGRIRIDEVDVADDPALAGLHEVRVVPTIIVFDEGQAVRRLTGARPREQLRRELVEDVLAAAA